MTYRSNLIGDMMQQSPTRAAYHLRILLRNANGNGKLVAEELGVTERQFNRWIKKLLDTGVADLRSYRQKVRKQVPGAIHRTAAGRQTPSE